jgi:hypothetical protein
MKTIMSLHPLWTALTTIATLQWLSGNPQSDIPAHYALCRVTVVCFHAKLHARIVCSKCFKLYMTDALAKHTQAYKDGPRASHHKVAQWIISIGVSRTRSQYEKPFKAKCRPTSCIHGGAARLTRSHHWLVQYTMCAFNTIELSTRTTITRSRCWRFWAWKQN